MMDLRNAIYAAAAIFALMPVEPAQAASFDCAQARTFLEKGICQDPSLSQLDDKLGELYKRALAGASDAAALKADQQAWLIGSRNVCEDAGCLTRVYIARIAKLEKLAGPATPSVAARATRGDACQFPGLELPTEFVVFAAGGYTGRTLDFQIDASGHEATQFDVFVHYPNIPVVLILGAYEPTVWNVQWSSKTKIVATMISGYHRQAIAGLDPKVPVLNSSYDNKGACGYTYVSNDGIAKLNPLSRRLFGKAVDLVYTGDSRQSGRIFVGEKLPDTAYASSSAIKPESFFDRGAPLAGTAGLEDAVSKGVIRKATAADSEAWVNAVIANTPKRDVPIIVGQGQPKPTQPGLHRAYVVLKPFTYPAGLYGGNLATFIIPKGVPAPLGNPGHSAIFDFNKMTCTGPLCGSR